MEPGGGLASARELRPLARYEAFALRVLALKREHFETAVGAYGAALPDYAAHFAELERGVAENAAFLRCVLGHTSVPIQPPHSPPAPALLREEEVPLFLFRSLVRDWAAEGGAERDRHYRPLVDGLAACLPPPARVLVPGAGLCRLAYDLSLRGYTVEASELSYAVLHCAAFLVACAAAGTRHSVRPFVHHIVNNRCRADQHRPVTVPDAAGTPAEGLLQLRHGDFLTLYAAPAHGGAWDAVVTCFFLDTAQNIFAYIDAVHRLLVPGGRWLNLGPLSWHFADQLPQPSVELAWDDLRAAVCHRGFRLVAEAEVPGPYTANPQGLMHQWYTAIFFHAVKTEASEG
eukprot:EG_transcript_16289